MSKAYFPCPLPFMKARIKVALKGNWIGLKTNAGTNIGPQNKMYLSAPGMYSESVK